MKPGWRRAALSDQLAVGAGNDHVLKLLDQINDLLGHHLLRRERLA